MNRAALPVARPGTGDGRGELGPAVCLLAAPAAVALAVAAVVRIQPGALRVGDVVAAGLVVVWAAAGVATGLRRRSDRVAPLALAIAGLGGVALLLDAQARRSGGGTTVLRPLAWATAGLAVAVVLQLLVSLPRGRLETGARRAIAAAGAIVGVATGVAIQSAGPRAAPWWWTLLVGGFLLVGVLVAQGRYRSAGAEDRRRFQWLGWALAAIGQIAVVVAGLQVIAGWPPRPWPLLLGASALLPLAVIAATDRRLLPRVDRLLAHTVSTVGLTSLVLVAYVIVVLGLGRSPTGSERSLLLVSMVAAGAAAVLYLPARRRLTAGANRLVYGERTAPDEALRAWAARLTRAVPLDELLLQLVESLRATMGLASAEIWTGVDGRLELAAGVPHHRRGGLAVGAKERPVVARAGVSGGTWVEVWLADLAAERDAARLRVAPIAHAGELLGLIVLERAAGADAPSAEDDAVVAELARQIGLALHNVQLDSALQESLAELQRTNEELRRSRLRLVSAGDAERRRLERDLHDGAQQHLVAMAVKLRLAEDLTEDDPAEAAALIGELRTDIKEAIAELRALAHGIFPPLLSSGGLAEALPAAASRAALPTTVESAGIGRYPAEIEAAVYFCCLEALQNAGKHAGPGAGAVVTLTDDGRAVRFCVRDDGVGFTPAAGGSTGHGFVNMADRLGAVGGELAIDSAAGAGTAVSGVIPLPG